MAASMSSRPSLIEGPIGKSLALFTLPILAGNVLQSFNGSVNAIWVGHYLGEAALAATSIANTILFLLLSLVFGIGMASRCAVVELSVWLGDRGLAGDCVPSMGRVAQGKDDCACIRGGDVRNANRARSRRQCTTRNRKPDSGLRPVK